MRAALETAGAGFACQGSCSWAHPLDGVPAMRITAAANAAVWREHVGMNIIDLPTVTFAGRAIATEAKPALCAGSFKRKYYQSVASACGSATVFKAETRLSRYTARAHALVGGRPQATKCGFKYLAAVLP